MEKNFVNSNYSIEDLEEFRDDDGFIDLDKELTMQLDSIWKKLHIILITLEW